MIVVTVFCCLLGYHLNWIRQRRGFFEWSAQNPSLIQPGYSTSGPPAPLMLRLLGETGVPEVRLVETDFGGVTRKEFHQELKEAMRLFSESEIRIIFKPDDAHWAERVLPR